MNRFLPVLVAVVCSCARAPGSEVRSTTVDSPPASGSTATATTTPTSTATSTATTTPTSTSTTTTTTTSTSTPPPLDGRDFLAEAQVLFRVAACGNSGEIPARFDAAVVAHHCDELARAYAEYRKTWVDVAMPFLAALRPKDLPRVVVYPFGGGDLVTALATFPDMAEITTISLEPAGDVRPVDTMPAGGLAHELAVHRGHLERLFEKAHSRTDNLEKESKTEMPGEIVFALAALVVHGFEPTSLRYFRLGPDGAVSYVTQADIDAAARKPQELRRLFENVELDFRAAGGSASAGGVASPVRVLRHIGYNLDDDHLKADGSLLAHLNAKGKVVAMTKAATHLLWSSHFSLIRGWLIDHVVWMVSDSTGIAPHFADAAGFVQETYGTFDGPALFGTPDARDGEDLRRLFAAQPKRELAFRYGYPDSHGHAHLIVTYRK